MPYFGDGSNLTSVSGVPVGGIIMWSGAENAVPNGFLLCNNTPVSRTTYAALFAVVSTTHGAGDGSSTFNVPDLRNRFVVGAGQGGGYSVAQTGGSADNSLPAHYHNFPGDDQLTGANGVAGWSNTNDGNFNYDATSNTAGGGKLWRTTTEGTTGTNENLPPYYALCYIIKS